VVTVNDKRSGWRRIGVGLLPLLGLMLCGQPLPAQDLGPTAPQEVQVSFDSASKLSGRQKLDKAEQLIDRMKDILKQSFDSLGSARSEKDLIKMNCVNEKLSSQKGLLKISEQAYIQLQDAVAQADEPSSNHEFTKISIAFQKMRGLGLETEGCAGEALRYTGDTRLEVDIDKDIPEDDPTEREEVEAILDDHPESSSPFE